MPKYLVKWPEEGAWATWSTLAGAAVGIFLARHGFSGEEISVLVAFVAGSIRLATGFLLPTPTVQEAVASVREHIDDVPKPTD